METDIVGWEIVTNNVENRMINMSLTHKLIPYRKLKRRTKAMNIAIKQYHKMITYNNYIKIKTSILRNISDDNQTDDSVTFSDDDYNNVYDSRLSLKRYMRRRRSARTSDDSYEIGYDGEENDIFRDAVNRERSIKKSKNKSSEIVNVGWQDVIKKKKCTSPLFFEKGYVQKDKQHNLNIPDKNAKDTTYQKTKVSASDKTCITEKIIDPPVKAIDSKTIAHSITPPKKVRRNSIKSIKKTDLVTNEIDERLQPIESCYKICERNSAQKRKKKNLMPLFDDSNATQIDNDSSTNIKAQLDQNQSNCFTSKPNIQQSLDVGSTNHPKDSGIEEDTEEEVPVRAERIHKKGHKKIQKACQSMEVTSSLDCRNNSEAKTTPDGNLMSDDNDVLDNMISEDRDTSDKMVSNDSGASDKMISNGHDVSNEMVSDCHDTSKEVESNDRNTLDETVCDVHSTSENVGSNNDNRSDKMVSVCHNTSGGVESDDHDMSDKMKSNDHDASSKMDSQDTTVVTTEIVDDGRKQQDSVQKQTRLQPKVTSTEIINKKYRIVSCNSSLLDDCSDSELSMKYDSNEKLSKSVATENSMEDSMSPLSKKRLQQLRRLNLTMDSESSLSEDDDACCNTENMRDKLLKRSEESCNSSINEDENINFRSPVLIKFDKSITRRNYKLRKHKEKENSCSFMVHEKRAKSKNLSHSEEFGQSLKFADSNDTLTQCTPTRNKSCSKNDRHERISENSSTNIMYYSDKERNSFKQYSTITDESLQDDDEVNKNSAIEKAVNKDPTVCSRPCNLQQLIERDNLVFETTAPSITWEDLHKDEIFLIDIPTKMLKKRLKGKKLVLKGKKLKLGKYRYKVAYKDIDHMSCVFNSGKSRRPYKAVNVKSVLRVVAHEKIFKKRKLSQHANETVNCADYANYADKCHKKHKFKKKQ
ncbi:uncharacterized protein LOC122405563 [Colletes gigas]|uniref:uncharacterized protein LOC122405563 n=1 Tax=Colletes gigas TaxID=935657 RepID=UPI001C9AC89A|nr:uncharacterized protein LOC122405563 [Colletes gigas]